jgi:hypothetical protein
MSRLHQFEEALPHVKCGLPARRQDWPATDYICTNWDGVQGKDFIMKYSPGKPATLWQPKEADLMAADWVLISYKGGKA